MQNHELLVFYCGHQSRVHVQKRVSTNRQLIVANLIYITLTSIKKSITMDPAASYTVAENEAVTNSSEPSLQTVTESSGIGEDTTLINTANKIVSSKETSKGIYDRFPQIVQIGIYL